MAAELLRSLVLAVQFLTVVPVGRVVEVTPRRMAGAMLLFPVVGLLLGGGLAVADLALRAVFPPAVGAGLLLAVWVVLTGALHLDGFLDVCDGLCAARPPRERLEILRDVHAGSFAVVGGIVLLVVKFALLLELPAGARSLVLLVVPALARAAAVLAARAFPYARPGPGIGRLFRDGLSWAHVAGAGAIAVGVAALALGWVGAAAAGVVALTTVVVSIWSLRRIGGLTGDVYGAVVELSEVAALLLVVAVGGAR